MVLEARFGKSFLNFFSAVMIFFREAPSAKWPHREYGCPAIPACRFFLDIIKKYLINLTHHDDLLFL